MTIPFIPEGFEMEARISKEAASRLRADMTVDALRELAAAYADFASNPAPLHFRALERAMLRYQELDKA